VEKYSNKNYKQAVLERNIQKTMGHPFLKTFIQMIDGNLLKNYHVIRYNIIAAENIFGPDLGDLKGKKYQV